MTTSLFTPLNHLGILQVSGEDASGLLQNLLTNDVAALAVNQAQLTGVCNAKGRLFATFYLVRREQAYQLILPTAMITLLKQRLTMYVLRSKVTISDESESMACLGLMPNHADLSSEFEQGLVIKLLGNTPRYLHIHSADKTKEICAHLSQQAWQLSNNALWQQADIEAGIATIMPDTKEIFTPQQINFDLIKGVSFSKGCYPGQEIVARLHYLGTPSRRLFTTKVQTDKTIIVGSPIVNTDNITVGHCVNANTIDNNVSLLLSLKLSGVEQDLFLNTGETIIDLQQLHAKD